MKEKGLTPYEKARGRLMKVLLVITIIAVIMAIIGLVIAEWEFGNPMTVTAIVIFVITLILCGKKMTKIMINHCNVCGDKFDYVEDVTPRLISEDVVGEKTYANVEFTCKCPNCGNIQKEKHTFKTSSGTTIYNLEDLVEKYFK